MEEARSKTARGSRKKFGEPVFITKTEIGKHFDLSDLATIDTWVAKGEFPPAHSQPSERYAVWRRSHWNIYVESGFWPKEAWRKPSP